MSGRGPALSDPPQVADETEERDQEVSLAPRRCLVVGAGLAVFAALLVWSQVDQSLVSPAAYRAVGAGLVVLAALYTVLTVMQAGRANVRLERSYSEHLERLSESLRHLAYHDSLTGLHNHRFFHDHLRSEFERARRYGHNLSIVMMDVNRFKEVNDRYGHLTGDRLLSFLGRLIGENVRGSDIAARYGGDEFALILPETDGEAARKTAAKIREVVATRRDWGNALTVDVALDIAAGVATFPEDASSAEELLHEADRRLYASKGGAPLAPKRRGRPLSKVR
jgi:diguanylate cyclase (GGDEF)-like protein